MEKKRWRTHTFLSVYSDFLIFWNRNCPSVHILRHDFIGTFAYVIHRYCCCISAHAPAEQSVYTSKISIMHLNPIFYFMICISSQVSWILPITGEAKFGFHGSQVPCTWWSPAITHQEKGSQHCTLAVADRQSIWAESLNSGLQPCLKSYPLPLCASGDTAFTRRFVSDTCWQLELSGSGGMWWKAAVNVLIALFFPPFCKSLVCWGEPCWVSLMR